MGYLAALSPELEARLRIARVLGSAEDRKAARVRLGLTRDQVAELTGLSAGQVRRRESDDWQMVRHSLESDACWRYVQLVAVARNLDHLLTAPLESEERS